MLSSTILSFVFFSYASIKLEATDFGKLNYYISLITILSSLIIFGSDNYLISRGESQKKELYKTISIFYFRTINTIFIISIASLIYGFSFFYLIGLSFPFIVFYEKNKLNQKNSLLFSYNMIFLGINFLIKIYSVYIFSPILIATSLLLDFSFGFFLINSKVLKYFFWPKLNLWASIFKKSIPYALSSISIILYSRVDQIILAELLDFNELSKYSIAVKIGDSTNFIFGITTFVLARKYLNTSANIRKIYKLNYLFAFILFIFLLTIGLFIFEFVFEKYNNFEVKLLFIIHLLNLPLVGLGSIQTKYMALNSLSKFLPLKFFISLILNVVFLFILVPIFSLKGAVFSTIIAQGFSSIIYPYFIKKLYLLRVA